MKVRGAPHRPTHENGVPNPGAEGGPVGRKNVSPGPPQPNGTGVEGGEGFSGAARYARRGAPDPHNEVEGTGHSPRAG